LRRGSRPPDPGRATRHLVAVRDQVGHHWRLLETQRVARELHDATLAAALKALHDNRITGKGVTPFLLGYFREHTHGASLQVNIDLILNNAALAAKIAVALAARMTRSTA